MTVQDRVEATTAHAQGDLIVLDYEYVSVYRNLSHLGQAFRAKDGSGAWMARPFSVDHPSCRCATKQAAIDYLAALKG
jgi:hypothetical protein